jgi:orotate phosphoribosyltransferase
LGREGRITLYVIDSCASAGSCDSVDEPYIGTTILAWRCLVSDARERLLRLLRDKAYKEGEFILSSGKRASYYIDAKQVTYDAEGAELVGRVMSDLVRGHSVDAIGGLTLGADAIAVATALISHQAKAPISAFIVRKTAKQHGLERAIEGPTLRRGTRVAIVDDVVTSAGSVLQAIEQVTSVGCEVALVSCLVDRQEGGGEILRAEGYRFEPVFTIAEIRALAGITSTS